MQAEQGQHGGQGILEAVAPDYLAAGETTAGGGLDVVLLHHVDEGAAHVADHLCGGHHGQHQGRQHQVAQGVMECRLAPGLLAHQHVDDGDPRDGGNVVEQADLARRGQPAEIQGEEHHHQQRQPEDGHGVADEAGGHDGEIQATPLIEGRQGPERDPHQQRDGKGRETEGQGRREVVTDLVQHRQAGDAGEAEIPGGDALQEVRVAVPEVQHLADEAKLQQVGPHGQHQQGDHQQCDATQNIKKHAYASAQGCVDGKGGQMPPMGWMPAMFTPDRPG